jgi:hypothetical protein
MNLLTCESQSLPILKKAKEKGDIINVMAEKRNSIVVRTPAGISKSLLFFKDAKTHLILT